MMKKDNWECLSEKQDAQQKKLQQTELKTNYSEGSSSTF